MIGRKYQLPAFLDRIVTQEQYEHWLRRKATGHLRRDRERGNSKATGEEYRIAIHKAVVASKGIDAYTGEQLDWSLLSNYDNEESSKHGRAYKKKFALLPSVDHVGDGTGPASFKICSWRTNDAKNDLSLEEFVELCRLIVSHDRK